MATGQQLPFQEHQKFGAQSPTKSWVPTCLIGCAIIFAILLLIGLIGGYYVYKNWKELATSFLETATKQAVEEVGLPEAEKQKVFEQIERVGQAVRDGTIDAQAANDAVDKLKDSEFIAVIILRVVETNYIEPSGLSDEEKLATRTAAQRVYRGLKEKQISQNDLDPIADIVMIKNGDSQEIKSELTDDELRQLRVECEKIANAAEIPDEPFEVNLGDEMKRIIDEVFPALAEQP